MRLLCGVSVYLSTTHYSNLLNRTFTTILQLLTNTLNVIRKSFYQARVQG